MGFIVLKFITIETTRRPKAAVVFIMLLGTERRKAKDEFLYVPASMLTFGHCF